jgi:hypothetical protein
MARKRSGCLPSIVLFVLLVLAAAAGLYVYGRSLQREAIHAADNPEPTVEYDEFKDETTATLTLTMRTPDSSLYNGGFWYLSAAWPGQTRRAPVESVYSTLSVVSRTRVPTRGDCFGWLLRTLGRGVRARACFHGALIFVETAYPIPRHRRHASPDRTWYRWARREPHRGHSSQS